MSASPRSPKNDDVKMIESIPPSKVLGVFGMSIFTRRDDLEKVFSEYGPIEKCEIIMNRQTGRSKGFGFVYFERLEDAEIARLKTNGIELNERNIRVDFSRTTSPHDPTPGYYNGKPIAELRRERDDRRGGRFDRYSGRDRDDRRGGRVDRFSGRDDRHYAPRRPSPNRSRSRSRDRYTPAPRRDDRDRDYYRRDEPRRDRDRDEYRPSRRSPSPRN